MDQLQANIFGGTDLVTGSKAKIKRKPFNPLHALYGILEGKKCGTCKFHFFRAFAKNYPKCALRKVTGSQKTDHSSRFTACGQYQPKPEKQRTMTEFKKDADEMKLKLGRNV